jgi:hypothetical protein
MDMDASLRREYLSNYALSVKLQNMKQVLADFGVDYDYGSASRSCMTAARCR